MARNNKPKQNIRFAMLGLKYLFSLAVSIYVCSSINNGRIMLLNVVELLFIWSFCNFIICVAPVIGQIFHAILLLIFNIQMLVLYFGNSYTTVIMLSNLNSLQDLSGNFLLYLILLIPLLIIMLSPTPALRLKGVAFYAIPTIFSLLWVCGLLLTKGQLTPLANTGTLIRQEIQYAQLKRKNAIVDAETIARFYRDGVTNHIDKPEVLPDHPNVVVLFVEGLSQSIVEDSRNLMENLSALESRSLFFENYYNHTFATYRGLNGQLYSGFQLSDLDSNKLISVQSIFHDMGYYTSFINTEPFNDTFTDYLSNMDFDNLISNRDWAVQAYATLEYISDKAAYERLMEVLKEQHKSDVPFFTAMYTFGTHVSLDSLDEKYQEGKDAELNKFYNLDIQLGEFVHAFESSELANDTILIVTADHATYQDKAFNDAFPDYHRLYTSMDRIPLLFYYPGIIPTTINAAGRNSLDLAPTILDYLDISAPNYFLGSSLFENSSSNENTIKYDVIFFEGSIESIKTSVIDRELTDSERSTIEKQIADYCSISRNTDGRWYGDQVYFKVSEDSSDMQIIFHHPTTDSNTIWFAVWGRENGQNDLRWYEATQDEEGNWFYDVRLGDHGENGFYIVHVYEAEKSSEDHGNFIARGLANVKSKPFDGT